jgi:hypothetical protein
MKKTVLLLTFVTIFVFSCRREHSTSTAPRGKKYPVTLHIANFLSHRTNFAIKHGANYLVDTVGTSASGVDLLYYLVYDEFGKTVHTYPIVQDSTMANFGTITDTLSAGSYEFAFAAGKKDLQIVNYQEIALADITYRGPQWQDTFSGGFMATVGSSGITQDVVLTRVVGKLEIDLTDAIPANADSLKINVNPVSFSVALSGGAPDGPFYAENYSQKIPVSAIGTTNFTIDRLVAPGAATVTIMCTDAGNNVVGSATVNNVVVGPNEKTILSGNLFGGAPPANSQTFTVKVDTAWSSTVNQVNFSLKKH